MRAPALLVVALGFASLTSEAPVALADRAPPTPPPDVRAVFDDSGTLVRLESRWGDDPGARLTVGKKTWTWLHRGATAATLVAGHGVVIAAVATDDPRRPFRAHLAGGDETAAVSRPGDRRDIPFAVAGTATDSGFALFFQEVQADDPTAAHTYLVELDKTGKAKAKQAKEIAVPWALAAAVDNGSGYHLALFYPGDARGMRLSMVSLSRDGSPQQHPDWASAAGFIADVHLVRRGTSIRAFYRGGPGGDRLLESDVSAIGQWGREPARAKDHGALSPRKTIALKGGKPVGVAR